MNNVLSISESNTQPFSAITLQEVKEWLRIGHTDEDANLTALIDTAINAVEKFCGISIKQRDLEVEMEVSGLANVRLPRQPILSSVFAYASETGSTVDLTIKGGVIRKLEAGVYTFFYSVGMDEIEASLKTAILQMIANVYANRGDTVVFGDVFQANTHLLEPFKTYAWV